MSISPAKTLSPAELAKLEHAFASDPSSAAYKPLAEAYLSMGRFMEAMVVCKKGVKAHPNAADPRLLLARVYADQGKDKKALEEALGALQVQPDDKAALRMAGALQLKTGEAEPGKANLLKAYAVDPGDPDTVTLLQQHKIEPPRPAAPAPVAAPVAPAPPGPSATQQSAAALSSVASAAGTQSPAAKPVATQAAKPAPSARAEAPAPRVAPPPRRPQVVVEEVDEDEDDEPVSRRRASSGGSGGSKMVTLGLLVAIPLFAIGYGWYSANARAKSRELKKSLDAASELLKHDSFDSYKKAVEAADLALEVDADSAVAHGYLAYAWAIRWGEHGGGDDARRQAEEHLAAGKESGDLSSHLIASEALIQTYSGKGKDALGQLEEKVKGLDAQGRSSSLLYLTLGLIQMNAGDLDRSRDSLDRAQGLSPDDPRTYASLGAVYRRLGQDAAAWRNYDSALRYEKDHPESLLGRSLLMLEQDSPNFGLAHTMLKKLLESDPPPSPRQLAAAHLARSLLISRVSAAMADLKPDMQQKLAEATAVPQDKDKARSEMIKSEETGFSLDKQNPELHLIKGRRLLAEGNYDAAVEEIRKAIRMDASRAQFYVELAKALMGKQGGEKEAAESLQTALKTMGDSPKLVVMLGNAYRRQGKLDDALAQYQRAVKDPKAKNPEARLAMGAIYRERSKWDLAQEQLEKASQEFLGQSDRAAMALTELGRVFQSKGDAAKADETYQRALNADEAYSPAYFYYATLLAKDSKQGAKAKMLAQEYLKRDPSGEHASAARSLAGG
ncbi:tetratricopeptide repeat protein [Myxococcus sp. AM009]|uniref:tetratricopeptide repeat protein n=1 Tax=unclassified Myxococcus TaxID=2648731 RepID=UPI001595DDFD|nr:MULTISPECIES: tetratricopeptide repeat protein [unclassified Myxococcus]NVJ03329.1 tetratricopeptide repeat protein [Myxococcus sp. AM009]NVJ18513.1 tetratricopeptide repeat protein [Myxococcus sp. AM010]